MMELMGTELNIDNLFMRQEDFTLNSLTFLLFKKKKLLHLTVKQWFFLQKIKTVPSLLQNPLNCINIPQGVLWINDSIVNFLIKLLPMNMGLGKLSACLGDIISIRNFKNYGRMLENLKIVKKPFRLHYWNLTLDLIEMKKIFIHMLIYISTLRWCEKAQACA